MLREHAEKRTRRRAPLNRCRLENNSDDEDDLPVPEDPRKWSKDDSGLVGSRLPAFVQVDMKAEDREALEGLTSALGYYQLFQPDSFVNEVCRICTVLYLCFTFFTVQHSYKVAVPRDFIIFDLFPSYLYSNLFLIF